MSLRLGLADIHCQFLAVHTFVTAVWRVGLKARGVAVGLVCLSCVFITLWVAIGAGMNKNYETPTPVRNSTLFLSDAFLAAHSARVSIGAGSALSSRENALLGSTSGC